MKIREELEDRVARRDLVINPHEPYPGDTEAMRQAAYELLRWELALSLACLPVTQDN